MVRATKVPLKTLTISLENIPIHFVNTHFLTTMYLLNEKIDNAHIKKCASYERITIAHVEHLRILLIGTLKGSKVSCAIGRKDIQIAQVSKGCPPNCHEHIT